ncbi:MAG: T9SS type A sorting domain-containing protein [Chitinophagales bacterium]|nr:T9SS type A sorting domain-containing protein [Chitinophagales bacterium]
MKKFLLLLSFLFFQYASVAQTWIPLGVGIGSGIVGAYINTMVFDSTHNYLYVGGNFSYAGDNPANSIAFWDGTEWNSLEIDTNYEGEYTKLLNYDDTILIADPFGRILKLYDTSIVGRVSSLNGKIRDLIVYNGELYACGDFISDYDDHPLNKIARWNGEKWQSLGIGIQGQYITSMNIYNGNLIVGGIFDKAGDSSMNNIAGWDGKNWFSLGKGITWTQSTAVVSAIEIYKNELYAGGVFDSAGNRFAKNIAKWNGANWDSVGAGLLGGVLSLLFKDSSLYVGGGFRTYGVYIGNRVARWDGNHWFDLDLSTSGTVHDLIPFKGSVIAGGNFTNTNDGKTVNNIAEYSTITNTNYISPKAAKFYIYPNPATDQLHIEATNIHNATVNILNLFGHVVLKQQFSDNASIDISNLPKGMYLINIRDEKGNVLQTEKVVKQ